MSKRDGGEADKVVCRTPTPGKQPTRIDRWKYEAVRKAILKCVPGDEKGIPFKMLPRRVSQGLTVSQRQRLGSVSWYTTVVKLDLEVRKQLQRVPGSSPQRLRRLR